MWQEVEETPPAQDQLGFLHQMPLRLGKRLPAAGTDADHLDHATTIRDPRLMTSSRRCGGGIRCDSGAVRHCDLDRGSQDVYRTRPPGPETAMTVPLGTAGVDTRGKGRRDWYGFEYLSILGRSSAPTTWRWRWS